MSNRPKIPVSDSIHETKNKIPKLDSELLGNQVNTILGNPGFPVINQNILFCLNQKSQMTFRQVCQSWKEEVDQPLFWIKKLNLKSHPKELGNVWIDLVGRIQKGSDLEKEVTECLMKWYGKFHLYSESGLKGISPTHIAARFGYTNIAMFVASYSEDVNAPKSNGWTPLHIAAKHGRIKIFKFLASKVENPNVPKSDGWTPLHITAKSGKTKMFKFLAPQVENPNAPNPGGWTPLQIAALRGSTEIFKFLVPQVANPNAPAPNGLTPLQLATNNNHTEIVETLTQMLAN